MLYYKNDSFVNYLSFDFHMYKRHLEYKLWIYRYLMATTGQDEEELNP